MSALFRRLLRAFRKSEPAPRTPPTSGPIPVNTGAPDRLTRAEAPYLTAGRPHPATVAASMAAAPPTPDDAKTGVGVNAADLRMHDLPDAAPPVDLISEPAIATLSDPSASQPVPLAPATPLPVVPKPDPDSSGAVGVSDDPDAAGDAAQETDVHDRFRDAGMPESVTEAAAAATVDGADAEPVIASHGWELKTVAEVLLSEPRSVRLSNCIAANPDFFTAWTVGGAVTERAAFQLQLGRVKNLGRKTAAEALAILDAYAASPVNIDRRPGDGEEAAVDPLAGIDATALETPLRSVLEQHPLSSRLSGLLATGAVDGFKVRDFALDARKVRDLMMSGPNAGRKTVDEAFGLLTGHLKRLGRNDDAATPPAEDDAPPDGLTNREWITQQLDALPQNRREVLEARYGLAGREPETLKEIADRVHVTRERVRQVEAGALKRLRDASRSRAAFQRLVDEDGEAQWPLLFGPESILPEDKVIERLRGLDRLFQLAIDVVAPTGIHGYLEAHAYLTPAGWFRTADDEADRRGLDRLLTRFVDEFCTPMPLETAEALASGTAIPGAGEGDRWTVRDGYLFAGTIGMQARRTVRMHAVAGRIARAGVFDIGTMIGEYRIAFPDDDCGSRMFDLQAGQAPHLFARLFDGIWLRLDSALHPSEVLPSPPFERRKLVETAFAEGGIADQLLRLLEGSGPQRVVDLRRTTLVDGRGRIAESSVGAILLSNPCFRRVAPGIFGLYSGTTEVPPDLDDHLLGERHCRLYCNARRSGAPQDYYPMWGAAYEMRLSAWARRQAPSELYRSLMAMIEPETWPAPADVFAEFQALSARDGHWQIGAERRLPLGSRFMNASQFFSALAHLVVFGWIGWVGANRATSAKSNNHDAADILAFLVMTGLVEPQDDWQAPHYPTVLAHSVFQEARRERHLHGAEVPDGSSVFAKLCEALQDAPPTASRGWVDVNEFQAAMPAWRADETSTGKAFDVHVRKSGINAESSFESEDWSGIFGA